MNLKTVKKQTVKQLHQYMRDLDARINKLDKPSMIAYLKESTLKLESLISILEALTKGYADTNVREGFDLLDEDYLVKGLLSHALVSTQYVTLVKRDIGRVIPNMSRFDTVVDFKRRLIENLGTLIPTYKSDLSMAENRMETQGVEWDELVELQHDLPLLVVEVRKHFEDWALQNLEPGDTPADLMEDFLLDRNFGWLLQLDIVRL